MTDYYAACLSLSQGGEGTNVSASLALTAGEQTRELSLEWPNLGDINSDLDVAEWLYSALSRLVTNYDEQVTRKARIYPTKNPLGSVRDEA